MNNRSILPVEVHPGDEAFTLPTRQKTLFSQWLQGEMRKRGWTQSDLGRASGLSRAVIHKLSREHCQPQPATLQAIASAFDIPIETTYRAAGLLPPLPETEHGETIEEAIHLIRKIEDPGRREIAVQMLRVLAGTE